MQIDSTTMMRRYGFIHLCSVACDSALALSPESTLFVKHCSSHSFVVKEDQLSLHHQQGSPHFILVAVCSLSSTP